MPQSAAGLRTEPPVSVPIVANARLAATAAPDPVLDPPVNPCAVFHGLRACGQAWSGDGLACANSRQASLPRRIPPALCRRWATAALRVGTYSFSTRECAVVGIPAVSITSFNA